MFLFEVNLWPSLSC